MAREVLQVDGISPEIKKKLQESAMQLYGIENASLLVRHLIDNHLRIKSKPLIDLNKENAQNKTRIVLRLPNEIIQKANEYSDYRLTDRNYYLTSIILKEFGRPQLMGDEIEVLRRSNYELSKIGTNLNQIARAFNVLVNSGAGKMPEVGKRIAGLRKEITDHTRKVLSVLNNSSVVFESKGKGQLKAKSNRGKYE